MLPTLRALAVPVEVPSYPSIDINSYTLTGYLFLRLSTIVWSSTISVGSLLPITPYLSSSDQLSYCFDLRNALLVKFTAES